MIAAPQLREPCSRAWTIAVQQLSRPVEPIRATAEPRLPSPDSKPRIVYRGKQPALRSKESKTVWRVLKRTDAWLTRVEILDAAKLFDWQKDGYGDRNAGNSALVNLVKGKWVDAADGKFRRTR